MSAVFRLRHRPSLVELVFRCLIGDFRLIRHSDIYKTYSHIFSIFSVFKAVGHSQTYVPHVLLTSIHN